MTASTTTIAPTRIVPIRFCHSLMPAPPRNYTPPSSYPPFGPVCRILFECLEGPVFCVPCDVSGISAEGSISMTPKRAGCETGWSQKSMNWRLWLSGIAIAGLMMAGGVRSGAQAPSPATAPQSAAAPAASPKDIVREESGVPPPICACNTRRDS